MRKRVAVRLISRIGQWFDHRLQLAASIREMAEHPVPRSTASWWYVFGSAALALVSAVMALYVRRMPLPQKAVERALSVQPSAAKTAGQTLS